MTTQHLVPFFPNFPYNPKDVRFIGSPIDLIIFDGLSEGYLRNIVFVEVKTGRHAHLSEHQREVRDAVKGKDILWDVIRIDRSVEAIPPLQRCATEQ